MTTPEPPPKELPEDFDLLLSAVMATERGRWFLSEFARRNRQADTQTVLAAVSELARRVGDATEVIADAAAAAAMMREADVVRGLIERMRGSGVPVDLCGALAGRIDAAEAFAAHTGDIAGARERLRVLDWQVRQVTFELDRFAATRLPAMPAESDAILPHAPRLGTARSARLMVPVPAM